MLHISVVEMFVNNLSAQHADMPIEVARKQTPLGWLRGVFAARFDRMVSLVQSPAQVLPPPDAPIVQN